MADIASEIKRRRTFAIISHPDAGKTTLTEKFLLYGGAINLAGSVKGKATARHAVSDWMEIEKERGISVTSSVLQFNYDGFCINILDTPGHQDFSEDTYRTLMAADSAVMVIDASKGVEAQTRKLFKVCVMRHIPIFTFINKMDRDANDTFDLLDDIEKELGIATCPINWPIGSGKNFKGVYERGSQKITVFTDTEKGTKEGETREIPLDSPEIDEIVTSDQKAQLLEEIELLDGASAEFDQDLVSKGELSPVFFGSALTNFGVEIFLKHFLKMTTSPLPRTADIGVVDPIKEDFSAFVFKIQANMNKAHRDRIAFMRICSGEFDAGMEEIIVGVVGVLQFEVLKYRLENEYNVEIRMETLPYEYIRWIENKDIDLNKLVGTSDMKKIKDLKGNPLLLWVNSWSIGMTLDRNEGLVLTEFGRN